MGILVDYIGVYRTQMMGFRAQILEYECNWALKPWCLSPWTLTFRIPISLYDS